MMRQSYQQQNEKAQGVVIIMTGPSVTGGIRKAQQTHAVFVVASSVSERTHGDEPISVTVGSFGACRARQ
jgi:hypothetical protein